MDPSSFYSRRTEEEDSSDEDFTISNESNSSSSDSSEESDEAGDTGDEADEAGDTENDGADETGEADDNDDSVSASSLAAAHVWGPVSSKQRSYAFTGREELAILPQVNSVTGKPEPVHMYELFITDALLDTIVSQTNIYAQQEINATPLTRRSRLNAWKPTTRNEIKKFLGIILYMGINGMPEISCYWSKNKLYAGSYISSVMTRERFEILLRCIHFRDNTDVNDPPDPIFKLRPLVTAIRDRCRAVYKPGAMFVIDESMVPFRGRTKIRHYLPGKTHKYGFKLYKVCTPSGYTWNFKIHSGSQTKRQGLNSTESLTVELCEELFDQGATLYADNYYCSLPLAEYLLDKKTYLCGTLKSTRKYLPKEVTESRLRKNEMKGQENSNGVKVFKWRDKRNVLTISTLPEHSDQLVPSGKVNRRKEEVFKPESVMAYNKAKKGVDASDQYTSYYSPLRKSKKWYRKLAFELITGLVVVNAWVLHCQYFPRAKMTQLQFREALVYSLIGDEPDYIRPGKSPGVVSGKRDLHKLTEKDGAKRATRKRCRGCYEKISLSEGFKVARNKARRVNTFCFQCEDKPHLCITCFAEKHSA